MAGLRITLLIPNSMPLTEQDRLTMLNPPSGKLRMVLDTDTYNEIDDQFALVQALLSPERLQVEAVYAAPFFNDRSTSPENGMENSYDEILRLLELLKVSPEGYAFRGSKGYMTAAHQPVESPAARDLVAKALSSNEILYVASISAPTNVASAILMEPKIMEKIVVVWLGGMAPYWHSASEFNLKQDLYAARVLFDSGVPLVHVPCLPVTSHLITSLPEIERYVEGKGKLGDFLAQTYRECMEDHFGRSRVIWDIAVIAWLLNPAWIPTRLTHSPVLTDQVTYSLDTSRHFVRTAIEVSRDEIFGDLFGKIARFAEADRAN